MSPSPSASTSLPSGPRTYKGSCHCGAVRFEVDFDPSVGTTRCNCTVCTKAGWWGVYVKPGTFRLLSGRDRLRDYSRSEAIHARFCEVCGIRPFGHGNVPELGGEFYAVNVNCLDDVDLAGIQVTYVDGRHDTWATLAVVPHVDPFSARPRA